MYSLLLTGTSNIYFSDATRYTISKTSWIRLINLMIFLYSSWKGTEDFVVTLVNQINSYKEITIMSWSAKFKVKINLTYKFLTR